MLSIREILSRQPEPAVQLTEQQYRQFVSSHTVNGAYKNALAEIKNELYWNGKALRRGRIPHRLPLAATRDFFNLDGTDTFKEFKDNVKAIVPDIKNERTQALAERPKLQLKLATLQQIGPTLASQAFENGDCVVTAQVDGVTITAKATNAHHEREGRHAIPVSTVTTMVDQEEKMSEEKIRYATEVLAKLADEGTTANDRSWKLKVYKYPH